MFLKRKTDAITETGGLAERSFFGDRKTPTKKYLEQKRNVATENGYVKFKDSLNLVRDNYDGDPTNPEKRLPHDLLVEIRCRIFGDEFSDEEGDRLKFYSAIGTPLDLYHGIDGWFEFIDLANRQVIVTVDVTENLEKASAGDKNKADLIIVDTEDERFLGNVDKVDSDDHRAYVVYVNVSDSTSDTYIEGLDLITDQIEKIFKEKGIAIRKAA